MKVEKRNGVTILSTDFRLDAVNAPKLKNLVMELARESGLKLVIDMEKTLHIDSSGCGGLMTLLIVLRANQGDMKIARAAPQPLNIFKLMELNRLLEIHDSLESAVESFVNLKTVEMPAIQ